MEQHKVALETDYAPGHIPAFYGQGFRLLGALKPNGNPQDGDFKAEFCVNGEWRFDLTLLHAGTDAPSIAGEYRTPDQITPELEAAIKGADERFSIAGNEYEIEWINNNWFECLAHVRRSGKWVQLSDGDIDESPEGPDGERMLAILMDTIASEAAFDRHTRAAADAYVASVIASGH